MTASPTPPDAQVGLPSEEEIARVLAETLRQEPIPDDMWTGLVESFRKLEAKFPNYPEGYSTSTDAFRQARAVLALFAPILAEARTTNSEGWRKLALDEHQKRLAAEAALAAERERCAKVAEDHGELVSNEPIGKACSRNIAAAIRAQDQP